MIFETSGGFSTSYEAIPVFSEIDSASGRVFRVDVLSWETYTNQNFAGLKAFQYH